jgi:hypothetical protein
MLNVKRNPLNEKQKSKKGKEKKGRKFKLIFFAYKTPKHGMSTPTGVRCRNTSSSEKRERKKVS